MIKKKNKKKTDSSIEVQGTLHGLEMLLCFFLLGNQSLMNQTRPDGGRVNPDRQWI